MTYTQKKITDSDGIEYEEVDYEAYLQSSTKHRIIQHLEHRYFVECDKIQEGKK